MKLWSEWVLEEVVEAPTLTVMVTMSTMVSIRKETSSSEHRSARTVSNLSMEDLRSTTRWISSSPFRRRSQSGPWPVQMRFDKKWPIGGG